MTLLILIRHSVPDYQPEINSHDWSLSQVGVMLCKRMADMIRPYEPTRVFTSVEPKAIQTGQYLAEHLALPFETVDGLQEQARRTERWYDDLEERQNDILKIFAEPNNIVYGEESGLTAYERFASTINDLRSRFADETLSVVTHGTVMALFLEREASLNGPEFWVAMGCPMFVVLSPTETGYTVITVENNVKT